MIWSLVNFILLGGDNNDSCKYRLNVHLQTELWEETDDYPVTHWATFGIQTTWQSMKNTKRTGTNRTAKWKYYKHFMLNLNGKESFELESFEFETKLLKDLYLNLPSNHFHLKNRNIEVNRFCLYRLSVGLIYPPQVWWEPAAAKPAEGVMCLEEGRQAGWLTNWFAGGLLVWTVPVSCSSRAFGPELGTEPLAGSLSTRQRAAGLAQWLSGEKVCVYCFPCGCQETRG